MQIWQAYNNHQIWCRSIYQPNKNLAPNFGAFNTILWIFMLVGCIKNCGIKGTPPIPSTEKTSKEYLKDSPLFIVTLSQSHHPILILVIVTSLLRHFVTLKNKQRMLAKRPSGGPDIRPAVYGASCPRRSWWRDPWSRGAGLLAGFDLVRLPLTWRWKAGTRPDQKRSI